MAFVLLIIFAEEYYQEHELNKPIEKLKIKSQICLPNPNKKKTPHLPTHSKIPNQQLHSVKQESLDHPLEYLT